MPHAGVSLRVNVRSGCLLRLHLRNFVLIIAIRIYTFIPESFRSNNEPPFSRHFEANTLFRFAPRFMSTRHRFTDVELRMRRINPARDTIARFFDIFSYAVFLLSRRADTVFRHPPRERSLLSSEPVGCGPR
jgi:hypothetical protein